MKRVATIIILVGLIVSLSMIACAEPVNPYWLRIRDGFANEVAVLENVYEREDDTVYIRASIPRIWGLWNQEWQDSVNRQIAEGIHAFIDDIVNSLLKRRPCSNRKIRTISYLMWDRWTTVKFNQGSLLSLTLTFYQYTGGAHGP